LFPDSVVDMIRNKILKQSQCLTHHKFSTLSRGLSQVNVARIYLPHELGRTKPLINTSPYRARSLDLSSGLQGLTNSPPIFHHRNFDFISRQLLRLLLLKLFPFLTMVVSLLMLECSFHRMLNARAIFLI